MPKNVSYISSSPLPLSVSDNIVTVPIGTVYPYGEGQTVIAMKLDALAPVDQKLDFVSFALERGGVRSVPLLQSRVSVDTGKVAGSTFSPLASLVTVFKNISGWVILLGSVLLLLAIYFISRYMGDREEASLKKARYENESPLAETERKISKSVQDEIRAQLGLDEEESLAN
jgi:hypothetical protein